MRVIEARPVHEFERKNILVKLPEIKIIYHDFKTK